MKTNHWGNFSSPEIMPFPTFILLSSWSLKWLMRRKSTRWFQAVPKRISNSPIWLRTINLFQATHLQINIKAEKGPTTFNQVKRNIWKRRTLDQHIHLMVKNHRKKWVFFNKRQYLNLCCFLNFCRWQDQIRKSSHLLLQNSKKSDLWSWNHKRTSKFFHQLTIL